jgi:hypothetical protein
MNERILELAKQAGLKKDHGSDREYIGDFDWRQFAQLIVKECADLIEDAVDHRQPASEYVGMIKQHFGVKE